MQIPPTSSTPKTSHKLRWFLGLFGLLVVILVSLQLREYDYWQKLAGSGFDSERERKLDEMTDRAIRQAEERLKDAQKSPVTVDAEREKNMQEMSDRAISLGEKKLQGQQPTQTQSKSLTQSPPSNPANINSETAESPAVAPPPPSQPVPTPTNQDTLSNAPAMPVAEINYPPVTEAMRSKTIDCEIAKLIVFRDKTKKYYCANIYAKDATTVKAEVTLKQPERVILFGQYLQLDCFISSSLFDDPLTQCHQAATFLDRWQLPKMSEAMGIKIPSVYNYIYLSQSISETNQHCGTTDAYGCFMDIPEYNLIVYTMQPIGSSRSFFDEGSISRATLYARYQTGGVADVVYSMNIKKPQGCMVIENHELIHLLNQQAYGTVPYWMDEGLVRLNQNYLYNNIICPPGQAVYNVTKKEGGQVKAVENFEIDNAYRQEPLNSTLVEIAQGNQCRKGIYMQISRDLKSGGNSYLQSLYRSFKTRPPVSETATAQAVWENSGKSSSVKKFLSDNKCNF